ncbi:MAG: xanthine/uracil/vitamin C permease [Treponema sp.]|jgi:AGZA family xanthine/uracil permease-like MFS transporter|nr:xanthine/uracil/vitamin C permease [Treponema sp.]
MKKSFLTFHSGDVGGMAYLIANNIVNYIIVIATLKALEWPDSLIFYRVIPGMSIGLMLGCLYYAYMAHKLAKKEGHLNVTALPSGVSTPAMFVFLFGVITPMHYILEDPEITWRASIAACFIGGFIEFVGGFIGPWLKRNLPRAAMLGTIAGIGFIWMATQGFFDVYGDPVLGLPILVLSIMGLFGGYLFPRKISPFVVAILGGIIYALALGRIRPDFSGIGPTVPNPFTVFPAMLDGFKYVAPYLTIVIPVEIYNFIETMDNVESANAAGDNYSVREAQFADGICTMISALFGGCIPNTVWLGHPGLKTGKAGIAYSWISGLFLGVAGLFGVFTLLSSMVPAAICAVTFLWCAIIMMAQGFKEVKMKHYAALAIAMVPSVADYLYTQVTGALGYLEIWAEAQANGLPGFAQDVSEALIHNGVMWNGVPAVKSGAILIGLIWGAATVFIIDRELKKTGIVFIVAAVLSFFGFIHRSGLELAYNSPFMIGYAIMAVMCFILSLGKGKWFKAPDDFNYV